VVMKPPNPQPDWVGASFTTVATFMTDIEAKLAKSALEAADIPCVMHRDDCGGLSPRLAFSQGIQLVVPSADAKRAARILAK
jgi:hypothetical protein